MTFKPDAGGAGPRAAPPGPAGGARRTSTKPATLATGKQSVHRNIPIDHRVGAPKRAIGSSAETRSRTTANASESVAIRGQPRTQRWGAPRRRPNQRRGIHTRANNIVPTDAMRNATVVRNSSHTTDALVRKIGRAHV